MLTSVWADMWAPVQVREATKTGAIVATLSRVAVDRVIAAARLSRRVPHFRTTP